MTWRVFCAAIQSRLSAMASRGRAQSAPTRGAYQPVAPTFRTQSADGLLISRRELLAHRARQARKHHQPVSPIYSQAREITHGILARGVR